MILTSVDLPAPFSPRSAWISPATYLKGHIVIGRERAEDLDDVQGFEEMVRAVPFVTPPCPLSGSS